ncbi:MAG: hypothetical protein B6I34_01520 [Anaerolineaceae bacterium 4572_32.1]|nr:MAG: hypothetical protein B6I34_01520 [Anaerolineaceae bacterium 4572_32.1]
MSTKTILVVEDNPTMAEGICDVLEMEDYNVAYTRNGVEGLARLKQGGIDLILADIMMPVMDGYEFYRQVRENLEWTAIPFIFLTAKGQKEEVRMGKRLGADDYLTKPFDPADLIVAVESKLHRAKEMEQATEQELGTLKQNILSALSHEFRTPLTYIRGYTDLLMEEDPVSQPEIFKDFLARIQLGSQRIHKLVEDFIMLVSLETGEVAYSISEGGMVMDILPTIRAEVHSFQEKAANKKVTWHTDWPTKLPQVFVNARMISNALNRLLDNAVKFLPPEGGEIWVSTATVNRQVQISIRDTGIGIPAQEHERIFERFYQVNRELYEQQGVGLGLAIAQDIVELHGGSLKVESEPDQGSTFSIFLPIAK